MERVVDSTMRRLFRRLKLMDNDRGTAIPEYAILIAGGFAAISGAGDLAAGGMNTAFNDADDGVRNVAVEDFDAADPPADDGAGESQGGGSDEASDDGGSSEGESTGGGSSGGESTGGGSSGGETSSTGGVGEHLAPGTGTIGYWKNHPEAWPTNELIIAGTTYSQSELLDIFDINGNKPAAMAKQLIAAELNVLAGNDGSCVDGSIADANTWLTANPIGSSGGSVNSAWNEDGDDIKTMLDEYNNGRLDCASHRG